MIVNVRANDRQSVQVEIKAYQHLTPKSAIAAANVAFGSASHCDVSAIIDGEFKQYRVTGLGSKRRARRSF